MSVPTTDRGGIIQVIRTLKANGWELDSVWDGEESTPVTTETEAVKLVMDLDDAHVYFTNDGGESFGWVRFVLGNEPDEIVCDYTTDLTPVDALINEWIA